MSVFRIYPTKSNTIASGEFQHFNAGQNAVADLWYGGGKSVVKRNSISRHLLKFDFSQLEQKFKNKEILSGNVVSYKLKMHNAIPRDAALEPEFEFNRLKKQISVSYDLLAFPINKSWDEGRGHDLLKEQYLVRQKGNPQITGYSNWNFAKQNTSWNEPGIFKNPSTAFTFNLPSQHFDIGDEDMNMDISKLISYWLDSGNTNNGLAIAYDRQFELITSDTRNIASFLTEETNSSFKPHIEVKFNQVIQDDRNQVSNNRKSRLFLYTFSGNDSVNFYSAGTVDIEDSSGNKVKSGLTINQFQKGAYYVDVFMSAATRGQRFKDRWKNVTFVPGFDQQDFVNEFQIKDNFFLNSSPNINEYTVTFYGLEDNSVIRNDEIVRVFANIRQNFSNQQPSPHYNISYRLIMNNQEEVIPWTSMHRAVRNRCLEEFLEIDATWLLHNQTYILEFRIEELGSKRTLPEKIKFKVQRPF